MALFVLLVQLFIVISHLPVEVHQNFNVCCRQSVSMECTPCLWNLVTQKLK